jgi:hypothetical protein
MFNNNKIPQSGLIPIKVENQGNLLTTQVNKINFTGSGVTASVGPFNDVSISINNNPIYASFYSTEDQPIVAINTPQPVRLNATFISSSINLSGSGGIVFDYAGIYQFTYIAQVENNSNSIQDAIFWIKYNNVDFPHSATLINIPAHKNPSSPSSQIMTFSLIGQAQNNNDKIELWWQATSTDVNLNYAPVSTYPEKPSVIANIAPIR